MIRFCYILSQWEDQRDQKIVYLKRSARGAILLLTATALLAPFSGQIAGRKRTQNDERKYAEIGTGIRPLSIVTISRKWRAPSEERSAPGSVRSNSSRDALTAVLTSGRRLSTSIISETRRTMSGGCVMLVFRESASSLKSKNARSSARTAIVIGPG